MKVKIILLTVLVLFIVAIPAFAGNSQDVAQDEELQALYEQMRELQQKIAEKRGIELPADQPYGYGFCIPRGCAAGYGGCFGPGGW